MKPIRFLGTSLKVIQSFPPSAKRSTGLQLQYVQRGIAPQDAKPVPVVGPGVEEIRIWDAAGTFRVLYTARILGVVYVLHAFQKKTQKTSQRDIAIARARFAQIGQLHP